MLKEIPDPCAWKLYLQAFPKQVVCFVKSGWSVVNFLIIFEREQICRIKLRTAEIELEGDCTLKNPPAAKGTALELGGGWQQKWGVRLGNQEGH